jgi:hypothetical protein
MKKIAIDPSLSNIKEYLIKQGYIVENVNMNNISNLGSYDAYIVSGLSENYLGIQDTSTKAPVIRASGMTPEDILNQLQA